MADDDFSEIFAKTPGRIKPGLSRMRTALAALGHPERGGRNVLVAGTNGKGTTSSFLWSLQRLSSPAVSLFSSPHLVQFRERFLFSASRITNTDLKDQLAELKAALGADYEPLSFFEVATLLAMSLFHSRGAKQRIWEVGLGGRWDCTNTVEPDLSVIVSIGLDHQEFLGDSLSQVLGEKLGIARRDKPLLLGNCPNLLSEPLLAQCRAAADTVLVFGQDYGIEKGLEGGQEGQRGFLALPGQPRQSFQLPAELLAKPAFMIDNFILALAAHALWSPAEPAAELISKLDWQQVWALPGFFGRSQRVNIEGQPVLWDVCHNVAGAKAFAASLKGAGPRPAGLVSILADKDIAGIIAALSSAIDIKAFYRIDHPRSPKTLASADENLPNNVLAFDSFAAAWNSRQSWLEPAGAQPTPLVICGSVMAIGAAMAHLADVSVELDNLWHFDRFIGP